MNTMKFLHLPLGQQFEFRGRHYTKVAPLIASDNADGKQKMIPRSALVTVEGLEEKAPKGGANSANPALEALQRYHQSALAELQSLGADEAKVGAARARLEAMREEVAKAIKAP